MSAIQNLRPQSGISQDPFGMVRRFCWTKFLCADIISVMQTYPVSEDGAEPAYPISVGRQRVAADSVVQRPRLAAAHRCVQLSGRRTFHRAPAAGDADPSRLRPAGSAVAHLPARARRCWRSVWPWWRRSDVRTKARPLLIELVEQFNETVHLMTLEGTQVRYVDAVEGTRALRVVPRTGSLLPAHCTSGGKALLAELPDERIRAMYADPASLVTADGSVGVVAAVADRGARRGAGQRLCDQLRRERGGRRVGGDRAARRRRRSPWPRSPWRCPPPGSAAKARREIASVLVDRTPSSCGSVAAATCLL